MGPREARATELAAQAKAALPVMAGEVDGEAKAGVTALIDLVLGLAINTARVADHADAQSAG